MTVTINITVNGKPTSGDVEPRMLLVGYLREHLGLTGTHVGCETGQCGACTVHLQGRAVKSCNLLAVQADDREVTTIEGLAPGAGAGGDQVPDGLHPMQAAFREHHALQCGFCTPGMVMSAVDFVRRNPTPSDDDIRHGLEGNLCRCTGYHNIVLAVRAGAQALRTTDESNA